MKYKRFTLLNPTKSVRSNLTRLKLSALLLLGLGLTGLQAQETTSSAGGNTTGGGGSVSYSIGQVVYTTHIGPDGSVAQGVQQIYIISDETGFDDITGISVSAYPNPATDYLILSVDESVKTSHALSQLYYKLYDMNGRLLQSGKISGNQTSIVMSDLVPATYFVKVYAVGRNDRTGVIQSNRETHHVQSNEIGAEQFNVIKTFKIIKTQ